MSNEQRDPTEVRDIGNRYIDLINRQYAEENENLMDSYSNKFIDYLNSLHNMDASGANALAESQAMNSYFGYLYTPFSCIDALVKALTQQTERVIILTGHAGDGKSTVALDVLKKLQGLPDAEPLREPLKNREVISIDNGMTVNIVKDMSELSADRRQQWLDQAFTEHGNWLIVSNTGPLLHSLVGFANKNNFGSNIENAILEILDLPFDKNLLKNHSLNEFNKELVVVNLTRIDNVRLSGQILTKLIEHPAWGDCNNCPIKSSCSIAINHDALHESLSVVEERIRWIYQLLNSYEQRLTLRQIVSQLAFALTGGMNCKNMQQQHFATSDSELAANIGLEKMLFSESFFGYRSGKSWPQSERIKGIALLKKATFGGPVSVNFERKFLNGLGSNWAKLPSGLDNIQKRWGHLAKESVGVRWRFAMRRMAFVFGEIKNGFQEEACVFLDGFLQSASLREFGDWQKAGQITLSKSEVNKLRTACLQVLLEFFSGFSSSQFHRKQGSLYLTLRRPDKAVVQPTQLVVETLPFREFDIQFHKGKQMPILNFRKGEAELVLTLPLLDYIRSRGAGELDTELSPVHQAQLEWFRAELLKLTCDDRIEKDELELLRAGIDGKVHIHRFFIDRGELVIQ